MNTENTNDLHKFKAQKTAALARSKNERLFRQKGVLNETTIKHLDLYEETLRDAIENHERTKLVTRRLKQQRLILKAALQSLNVNI